eukprot:TRINITY_DN3090_c0_g1_i1.p1 TRINITY_DN3090_c0_g1~~TRINITY_DN3090_c0_g1_i1.p1  ORF type:complete len:1228 (+),score=-6.08 TRINITY_DN3090_c0_g1_i1:519-3686(+)
MRGRPKLGSSASANSLISPLGGATSVAGARVKTDRAAEFWRLYKVPQPGVKDTHREISFDPKSMISNTRGLRAPHVPKGGAKKDDSVARALTEGEMDRRAPGYRVGCQVTLTHEVVATCCDEDYDWSNDPLRPLFEDGSGKWVAETGHVTYEPSEAGEPKRWLYQDRTDGVQVFVVGPRGDGDFYSTRDLRLCITDAGRAPAQITSPVRAERGRSGIAGLYREAAVAMRGDVAGLAIEPGEVGIVCADGGVPSRWIMDADACEKPQVHVRGPSGRACWLPVDQLLLLACPTSGVCLRGGPMLVEAMAAAATEGAQHAKAPVFLACLDTEVGRYVRLLVEVCTVAVRKEAVVERLSVMPAMERWMWKDGRGVDSCERCYAAFSVLRRKHHCRHCGGLYCTACSDCSFRLRHAEDGLLVSEQRVCFDCYENLTISPPPYTAAECYTDEELAAMCASQSTRGRLRRCRHCRLRFTRTLRQYECTQCTATVCGGCSEIVREGATLLNRSGLSDVLSVNTIPTVATVPMSDSALKESSATIPCAPIPSAVGIPTPHSPRTSAQMSPTEPCSPQGAGSLSPVGSGVKRADTKPELRRYSSRAPSSGIFSLSCQMPSVSFVGTHAPKRRRCRSDLPCGESSPRAPAVCHINSVSITATRETPGGRVQHILVYTHTRKGQPYTCARFYNDFLNLQRALPTSLKLTSPFPAKTGFVKCTGQALDERRRLLQAWIRELVSAANQNEEALSLLEGFLQQSDEAAVDEVPPAPVPTGRRGGPQLFKVDELKVVQWAPVWTHVYRLQLNSLMSIYLTGVEVAGREIYYEACGGASGGVRCCAPRTAHILGAAHYRRVRMGTATCSGAEIDRILKRVAQDRTWSSNRYHVLRHNSNDFSSALCEELGVNSLPGWINGMSAVVGYLLPDCWWERWASSVGLQRWQPDEEVDQCRCGLQFSILSRRHHCRNCGCVFCDACTTSRCLVPMHGDKAVRVCDQCAEALMRTQEPVWPPPAPTPSHARRRSSVGSSQYSRRPAAAAPPPQQQQLQLMSSFGAVPLSLKHSSRRAL